MAQWLLGLPPADALRSRGGASSSAAERSQKRRGSTAQGWKSLHELEDMAKDSVVDTVSEELQGQAEGLIKNNVEIDEGGTESRIAEAVNERTRTL